MQPLPCEEDVLLLDREFALTFAIMPAIASVHLADSTTHGETEPEQQTHRRLPCAMSVRRCPDLDCLLSTEILVRLGRVGGPPLFSPSRFFGGFWCRGRKGWPRPCTPHPQDGACSATCGTGGRLRRQRMQGPRELGASQSAVVPKRSPKPQNDATLRQASEVPPGEGFKR